ncbi:MAG: TetR family transcriptional regulator [Firmicutes bacterium]|nr:TetR family transcriptional regulator [Bacillota bacterium]
MRKAKEDAMITRKHIMEAAFDSFFNYGFEGTSLEMVAAAADVTRGAIYWNFKDKKELYREVVKATLQDGADVVSYAYNLPDELSYEERLYEIFWFAQSVNEKVDFVYKTMIEVSNHQNEFLDLRDAIQLQKIKLYRYFVEETRIHIRDKGISSAADPEIYASDLFLLFEGMFLIKHMSIGIADKRDNIIQYIKLIIKELI